MYLILTPEQADVVRGEYADHYTLQPIKHGNLFWLPADIIDLPQYAQIRDLLITLPIVEEHL